MSERVPERRDIAPQDQWQLEDIYPDQQAWEADFSRAGDLMDDLRACEGQLNDPGVLLAALMTMSDLERVTGSLFAYARMRRDEDNRRTEYQALASRAMALMSQAGEAGAFLKPELLALPQSVITEALASPAFKDYRVPLGEIERQRPHTLSASEERLVAMAANLTSAPGTIYDMLTDADMAFPPVNGADGTDVELTQSSYIPLMMNPDRRIRRQAYENLYNTYGRYSATIPAVYAASVKADVFAARAAKHPSALAAALFPDAVPVEVYDNLIQTAHRHLDSLTRYMAAKAKQIGLEDMGMEDVYVPAASGFDLSLPFGEAYDLVVDCLAPLGADYQDLLRKARAERWIDVYENAGKSSGAYSWGTYDSHPYVLLNYHPSLNALLTVAHEMGHSMHTWFSNGAQPFTTSNYSLFVAEVASTTNECLVLMELLERYINDRGAQICIIAQLLENFRTTLFRQTMFAEFEKEAHAMEERGEPLTAESLNAVYAGLNRLYYPGLRQDELIAREWMRIPHVYRAFDVYKYATGFSAAMALATAIRQEGQPAVERYRRFLSLGSSMQPIELLKVAGVDMASPAAVESALGVFDQLVERYISLI